MVKVIYNLFDLRWWIILSIFWLFEFLDDILLNFGRKFTALRRDEWKSLRNGHFFYWFRVCCWEFELEFWRRCWLFEEILIIIWIGYGLSECGLWPESLKILFVWLYNIFMFEEPGCCWEVVIGFVIFEDSWLIMKVYIFWSYSLFGEGRLIWSIGKSILGIIKGYNKKFLLFTKF